MACNGRKGSRLLHLSGLKLHRSPGPPASLMRWHSLRLFHTHRSMAETWTKYLCM